MDKRAPDPIIILKVDTNCCDDCSGKLQKALLEINGVNQAIVDPQKKSVSIRGNANSCMLIEEIARMGKRAELMFYDKEPKVEGHHQKNVRFAQGKHPSTDDHHKQNVRQDDGHKHFCCDDHDDGGEENMPSWGSKNIFGSHSDYPRQTHFCPESSRHDARNPNYSRWFREEPLPYDHPRWRMPPPPPSSYFYGPFRGRRPMSQFDHFPH
ncbi:uncharacterized protein LOC113769096 [Coffea eugenioides]|uniref:uncharacterized protein LOC113769096 n=1 Tax=Coffea eugenioides TaxID=49369 RepID=UPI000F606639|nr:uncharacterized protein LOC113769096 [Coffea eugenioides]